jgi:hypothetical protein
MSRIATQFPLAKEEGSILAGLNISAMLTKRLKMPTATQDRFSSARATPKLRAHFRIFNNPRPKAKNSTPMPNTTATRITNAPVR